MADEMITLDVREDLRNGGEPLPKIMAAVKQMEPGQSLKLLATFEPIPLFHVMASKGFRHEAKRIGEGDWEVLFTPDQGDGEATAPAAKAAGGSAPAAASGATESADDGGEWPKPVRTLDNRGLMPPEPLINVLEALETLSEGQVLEVFNDREPVFLYPELEQRDCAVRTEKLAEGVRLEIRRKGGIGG